MFTSSNYGGCYIFVYISNSWSQTQTKNNLINYINWMIYGCVSKSSRLKGYSWWILNSTRILVLDCWWISQGLGTMFLLNFWQSRTLIYAHRLDSLLKLNLLFGTLFQIFSCVNECLLNFNSFNTIIYFAVKKNCVKK